MYMVNAIHIPMNSLLLKRKISIGMLNNDTKTYTKKCSKKLINLAKVTYYEKAKRNTCKLAKE